MAYAEKYNFSFDDDKAVTWRIGIKKLDYAGASTELDVASGNPLTISWKGGDMFEPIRSSEATVEFYSQTNFYFKEFWTAAETDYLLEIKKAGVVFWQGVFIPETYSEPYTDIPYPVILKFSDGLGYLKFVRFGTAFLDIPIIQTFMECLKLLPYSLKIREVINVIENDFADIPTNGFMNKTFLNNQYFLELDKKNNTYMGMFAYQVMADLLISIGAYICQEDNMWKIIRIEELEKTTPGYIDYVANGITIDTTGTISPRKTIENDLVNPSWILQDQELTISEVFDEIIYRYEFLRPQDINISELITDSNMEKGAVPYNNFNLWKFGTSNPNPPATAMNQSIENYAGFLDIEGKRATFEFWGAILTNTHVLDTSYSITALQTNLSTVTFKALFASPSDTITLSMNGWYQVESSITSYWPSILYDIRIHFKIRWGTYYLKEETNGTLSWTTTSTDRISIKIGKLLNNPSYYYPQFIMGGDTLGEFFFKYDFAVDFPVFPVNAENDFEITMYVPENPKLTSPDYDCLIFAILNFSCVFNHEKDKLLNFEEKIFTAAGIRKRKKEIVVKFGDHISRFIYSAFKTTDTYPLTLSDAWFRRGIIGTTYKSSEVFIHSPYIKYFTNYRQRLRGTIYANGLQFTNTLLTKFSELFMINSMSYDVKNNSYQLELEQINYTAPIIITVDSPVSIDYAGPTFPNVDPDPSDTYDLNTPNIATPVNVKTKSVAIGPSSYPIKKVGGLQTNDDTFQNYPSA